MSNGLMESLTGLARNHSSLVAMLDSRAALRAAVELLADGGDVAWLAESGTGGDGGGALTLAQIHGHRTGLLRGLQVPNGLGLTGMVHESAVPAWVDDYFASSAITHTFDDLIKAEQVQRLLAVPVMHAGRMLGVLAVGARSDGVFGGVAVERATRIADEAALAVVVAERAQTAKKVAVYEERSRLAAELHDSVGALLFAIGSGVARLASSAAEDPGLREQLDQLQQQAADASSALRHSLRVLRSSPTTLALAVGLQTDCAAFAERTGLPAEMVVLDAAPPALPAARTDVLLTGVREALLNVEKHAQAGAVVVTLSAAPGGGIAVAVTDDGVGLAPGHRPGLGLTKTDEAMGRLGGTLSVTANAEGGTTWRASLPC